MAKSSIHIQAGGYNFFRHNDRSQKTKNAIFDDEKNEYWNDNETAYKLWKYEVEKRSSRYTERTGKKLHKKTLTHLSAIVNLNQHHTLDDLRPLVKYIEGEFGAKVVQVAIHRDEGHIEQGKPIKNYHAHIEMVGIDQDGNSVRRKLDRKALIKLQDKTAELLRMERGTNYTRERKPRPKRLDTYEYKAAKEREEAKKAEVVEKSLRIIEPMIEENKQLKAKVGDINKENARLRAQLREAGATREQYAALEAEVRKWRKQAKAKELTIDDLRREIDELQQEIVRIKSDKKDAMEQNERLRREISTLEAEARQSVKLALFDRVPREEKDRIVKYAEKEIEHALIAHIVNETDAPRIDDDGVYRTWRSEGFKAEISGVFDDAPHTRNDEYMEIARKTGVDGNRLKAVSFAAKILFDTIKENLVKYLYIKSNRKVFNDFQIRYAKEYEKLEKHEEQEQERDNDHGHDNAPSPSPFW